MDFRVKTNNTVNTSPQGAYGQTLLTSIKNNGGLSLGGNVKPIQSPPTVLVTDTGAQTVEGILFLHKLFTVVVFS